MLNFSVSFRHGGYFDITLKVLIIPFQTVCFMFGAGNIHTNKEEKLVKENVLVNMPTGCEKSQISNNFTRCEPNLRT